MIYDLFDDDPSFELVGALRSTRRVCVTIQDFVMSTENLEREFVCTVVQIRMPLVELIDPTSNIHHHEMKRGRSSEEQRMACSIDI